ncbi:MAG: preprotein translocase subunit SecE [Pseudomonadota bacterium]
MSNRKIVISSFFAVGFFLWYIVDKIVLNAFLFGKVTNYMIGGFLPSSQFIAFLIAAAAIFFSLKTASISDFCNDVVSELKKVAWPNKKETSGATLVVIITVIIFSIILGIFDFVWVKVIQLFL